MQVIPKIKSEKLSDDKLKLSLLKSIYFDESFKNSSKYILSIFKLGLKRDLKIVNNLDIADIKFTKKDGLQAQSYRLNISNDRILIVAADIKAAIYATQTLRIIAEFDLESKDEITCREIYDYPEFLWRGLLYDEARHFFGMDAAKRLMDIMALHKLNVLHWHLTDSEGWRIEIKKYPLLTEIGSKRKQSQINGWKRADQDGIEHFGFYTQDQMRELIAYAVERGIDIVPEIDMPGHFQAASAAYPWLTCKEIKRDVPDYFGFAVPNKLGIKDWNRPACVAKEEVYTFIKDVIDEISELFPFKYFHIGADEVPTGEWAKCDKCRALMKKKNFASLRQLQSHFIARVKEYTESKGLTLIGWNEILKGDNIDKNILVQYWTPIKDSNVNSHLEIGGNVIISKHQYFYFDMPYSLRPLEKTYNFSLPAMSISDEYRSQIKGVEGTVWTEWIANKEKLEFQLFPRMEALAEVSWDQGKKNYAEFMERLEKFKALLDKYDIKYANNNVINLKNPIIRNIKTIKWFNGALDNEINKSKEYKKGE